MDSLNLGGLTPTAPVPLPWTTAAQQQQDAIQKQIQNQNAVPWMPFLAQLAKQAPQALDGYNHDQGQQGQAPGGDSLPGLLQNAVPQQQAAPVAIRPQQAPQTPAPLAGAPPQQQVPQQALTQVPAPQIPPLLQRPPIPSAAPPPPTTQGTVNQPAPEETGARETAPPTQDEQEAKFTSFAPAVTQAFQPLPTAMNGPAGNLYLAMKAAESAPMSGLKPGLADGLRTQYEQRVIQQNQERQVKANRTYDIASVVVNAPDGYNPETGASYAWEALKRADPPAALKLNPRMDYNELKSNFDAYGGAVFRWTGRDMVISKEGIVSDAKTNARVLGSKPVTFSPQEILEWNKYMHSGTEIRDANQNPILKQNSTFWTDSNGNPLSPDKAVAASIAAVRRQQAISSGVPGAAVAPEAAPVATKPTTKPATIVGLPKGGDPAAATKAGAVTSELFPETPIVFNRVYQGPDQKVERGIMGTSGRSPERAADATVVATENPKIMSIYGAQRQTTSANIAQADKIFNELRGQTTGPVSATVTNLQNIAQQLMSVDAQFKNSGVPALANSPDRMFVLNKMLGILGIDNAVDQISSDNAGSFRFSAALTDRITNQLSASTQAGPGAIRDMIRWYKAGALYSQEKSTKINDFMNMPVPNGQIPHASSYELAYPKTPDTEIPKIARRIDANGGVHQGAKNDLGLPLYDSQGSPLVYDRKNNTYAYVDYSSSNDIDKGTVDGKPNPHYKHPDYYAVAKDGKVIGKAK